MNSDQKKREKRREVTKSVRKICVSVECATRAATALRVKVHGLPVTGHWSLVTGSEPPVTGHGSPVTDCEPPVTGHRSLVTGF